MAKYTKEDILELIEDEDVEFIRLQFTDMFGNLKNIAVTARELPRALENKCTVNGSYIAGAENCSETELYLCPDPDTFVILPWRPQQGRVARMICDLRKADGSPCENSSRDILRNINQKLKQHGYTCYVDTECEFFLFHLDDNGIPTTVTHEQAGYLDISPLDLGENARRDMVLTLEDIGIEVESSHHEKAPAQHEIDFRSGEIEEMADRIITFKMAVRTIAKRHGLHATFMPKPKAETNGSGMHIHFTLHKDGKNIFDGAGEEELSKEAYYFMGGILEHSREMALITNPLVNSYKRLVPGYGAPTDISWTKNNQNSLVRAHRTPNEDTRIELRSPDPSANPYLVYALCLAAGLDGISKKMEPKEAAEGENGTGETLPQNMKEAIDVFEKSEWVKNILGESLFERYVSEKKKEWNRYTHEITNWEKEEYLYRV